MSVNWNLFLWVCLSVLSRFLFFSLFSNSGSSHTEPGRLLKQCMQSQCDCPTKTERHIFRSQTHWRIRYKFFGKGGGGLLQHLLTKLSTTMISVRKTGLGATLKMAQNGPFRVISPTKGGGGGATPTTIPLKPPMKPVTNVCAENFPLRGVQKWFIYLIGRFHQFRHVFRYVM